MGTGSSSSDAVMASITVSNRTIQGRSERIVLNFVNLKGSVYKLKDDISGKINLPISDIELVYCGQQLDDSKQLDIYGVKPGSTLFALKRHISEPVGTPGRYLLVFFKSCSKGGTLGTGFDKESLSEVALRQLVATLQTALLNPAYRTTVERMLNSPEAMQNIITATPGLEDDPVALSMLEDQELLAILAHPGNIRQIVKKHPAFGQAANVIAAAVSEEGCHSEEDTHATGSYSLDQMSDEEDVPSNRPGPLASGGGGQAITASQLSAALAAATGQQSSPANQGASNLVSQGSPLITQDFFQEAIRQAQDTTSQTQIEQLRDMGITDEALARRALQATGGDLRAALDLIFGDGIF